MVEEEIARVNTGIFGISELKWMGIGECNLDGHCTYYCGQESLRRNGIALTVTKDSEIQHSSKISGHIYTCG